MTAVGVVRVCANIAYQHPKVIASLPRGEKQAATNALRQYVYGPGKMQPDAAIERYKERRVRDAQAPVGSTDSDELDASDSDADPSRCLAPAQLFR